MTGANLSAAPGNERRMIVVWTVFFAVLTALFTYPISTSPNTYFNELADVRLIAWTLAWNAHAFVTDPLHVFDANIFFPNRGTLTYSEAFLAPSLIVAPINWAGYPVLAYNIVMLTGFVLSGVGAGLWVRHMTGSSGAGLFAGLVWAFAPSKFDQLPHLHMLVGQWIPFALLYCCRYVETGRGRYLYATAGFAGLQFAFSMHYGLYLVVALLLYGPALLALLPDSALRAEPFAARRGRHLASAAILYGALTLPVALPYMGMNRGAGPERAYADLGYYSARPASLVAGSPLNRAPHVAALSQRYKVPEANFFIGFLPMLLAAAALLVLLPSSAFRPVPSAGEASPDRGGTPSVRGPPWEIARRWCFRSAVALTVVMAGVHLGGFLAAWQDRAYGLAFLIDVSQTMDPAVWLAVAATVAVVCAPTWRADRSSAHLLVIGYLTLMFYLFALGPLVRGWGESLGNGPYWMLYEWVFPFRGIRAAGRIGQLWVLCVGALGGFSVAWLLRGRRRWATAVLVALLSTVVWEYRTWPLPSEHVDPAVDPIYDWLAEQSGDFAVVHAPLEPGNSPWQETRYMFGSTRHWKRLVNGYSGFFPPDYQGLAAVEVLTPEFFKLLRSDFPVRFLLVHDDWLSNRRQHERVRELVQPNADAVFVEQVGHTYVFEVPRDRGSGSYVRRRYTAEQLRDSEGIQFLVRGPQIAADERVLVLAGWGLDSEVFEVGPEWQGARVEMTPRFLEGLGGNPGYFEIRVHLLVPLGTTGASIASGFTADVQDAGVGVGVEAVLLYESEAPGFQAHTLDRFGTRIVSTAEFPPSAEGATAFREHIEQLAPETIVAVTIHRSVWGPLDAAAIAGLRMIGAEPSPDEPVVKMVVVGRKGATPGQALQHVHHKRAVVDIEAPTPSVELIGIGLY